MKASAAACAMAAIEAVMRDPPITYIQEDCQAFIEATVRRAGGKMRDYAGSNDMYRNACTEVIALEEAIAGRKLVPGMVLFIVSRDGGEPIQYKGDGRGNASHVGWFTGGGCEVVHSSQSRGGVFASTLKNGWTHAGWLREVDYGEAEAPVTPAATPSLPVSVAFIDLPADETVFHRISPSSSSAWFARIRGGEQVELVSVRDGWARVRYSGHEGYVMAEFVTGGPAVPLAETQESADPVAFALPRAAAQTLLAALRAALEKGEKA